MKKQLCLILILLLTLSACGRSSQTACPGEPPVNAVAAPPAAQENTPAATAPETRPEVEATLPPETLPAETAPSLPLATEPAPSETEAASEDCAVCSLYFGGELAEQGESWKVSDFLAHGFHITDVAPTCTGVGYSECVCGDCGQVIVINRTLPRGHQYRTTTTAPTCTEDGYTAHTCWICSDSYCTDVVAAPGHDLETTVVPPTCTEDGYTLHSCSRCGAATTDSIIQATGHVNTTTETRAATCQSDGYTRVVCNDCQAVVSETTIPQGECSYTTTKRMADVAKALVDAGDTDYISYVTFTEWNVDVCDGCGYPDMDTFRFAYTNTEATDIMLGYVNELRRSIYGDKLPDVVADTTMIEMAAIRAKEISINYSHGGTFTGASAENIINGGSSIYEHFASWKASTGHYNAMIRSGYICMGYAVYKSPTGDFLYGVMLLF